NVIGRFVCAYAVRLSSETTNSANPALSECFIKLLHFSEKGYPRGCAIISPATLIQGWPLTSPFAIGQTPQACDNCRCPSAARRCVCGRVAGLESDRN